MFADVVVQWSSVSNYLYIQQLILLYGLLTSPTMLSLLSFFREEGKCIKVPRDMDDAKALGKVLSKYKDTFYVQVLVAYFATYVLYPFSDVRSLCWLLFHEKEKKNANIIYCSEKRGKIPKCVYKIRVLEKFFVEVFQYAFLDCKEVQFLSTEKLNCVPV